MRLEPSLELGVIRNEQDSADFIWDVFWTTRGAICEREVANSEAFELLLAGTANSRSGARRCQGWQRMATGSLGSPLDQRRFR